jgi:hypothetical protein
MVARHGGRKITAGSSGGREQHIALGAMRMLGRERRGSIASVEPKQPARHARPRGRRDAHSSSSACSRSPWVQCHGRRHLLCELRERVSIAQLRTEPMRAIGSERGPMRRSAATRRSPAGRRPLNFPDAPLLRARVRGGVRCTSVTMGLAAGISPRGQRAGRTTHQLTMPSSVLGAPMSFSTPARVRPSACTHSPRPVALARVYRGHWPDRS